MSQLFIGSRKELPAEVLEGMFRLRYKVFHELLAWNVEVHGDQERDRFDEQEAYYVILHDPRQKLALGCWRMLPTTGPYMLRDIFPQLLPGKAAPCSRQIWEISRFATTPSNWKGRRDPASFGLEAMRLIQAALEFGHQHQLQSFVAVTSTRVERRASQFLDLRRLGNSPSVDITGVPSVACWVEVESSRRRMAASF